ncbi:MAG: hypothetical protein KDC44_17240, partial [Phaeodactylibacter sp.]|nr:hypothetical protein [Phaeodactylibacter sp.]
ADADGLDKILQTDYSLATLNTVYDVLKYAYLPYDEIPFSLSYFEDEAYVFPAKYALDEVNDIEGEDENEEDTRSSHPNIGSRRAALLERIKPYLLEERRDFIVSEERFREVRDLARFELPQLYLYEDALPEVVYTAHALLQQFPENVYLKKAIGKALYTFAAYKNGSIYGYPLQYSQVEGELQRVYYFLKKLSTRELTILATRYLYQLHLEDSEDVEIASMLDDTFKFLASNFETLTDFRDEMPAPPPATEEETEEEEEKSKFEKIREKRRYAVQPGEKEYWKLAFIDYLSDSTFIQGFEAGKEAHEEVERRLAYYDSRVGRASYRAYQKEVRKHGLQLGIERIGVVQPLYLLLNNRYESEPLYLESDAGKTQFRERLQNYAASIDLELQLLDPETLKNDEVQVFNDIRYLNDWIGQQLTHDDLPLMVSFDQERIKAIAERYDTDYFLWTGIIGLDKGKGLFIYALLFDVQTGKREVVKYELLNKPFKEKIVEKQVMDMLSQIRTKRE